MHARTHMTAQHHADVTHMHADESCGIASMCLPRGLRLADMQEIEANRLALA
jgi:hypothetical protein